MNGVLSTWKICIPYPDTGFISISVYSEYKPVYVVTLPCCGSSRVTPAACWRCLSPAGLQQPASVLSLCRAASCPRDSRRSWLCFCIGFGCCVGVQRPRSHEMRTNHSTNKCRQTQRIELRREELNPTYKGCQLTPLRLLAPDSRVLKSIWSGLLIYCYLLCLILILYQHSLHI